VGEEVIIDAYASKCSLKAVGIRPDRGVERKPR